MTCCSPHLGNESLSAAGLGKERESTQSKQYTELLPTLRGNRAQEPGRVFIGDFFMECRTLLNSTFQVQREAVLHQLGQCCYAGTKPDMVPNQTPLHCL